MRYRYYCAECQDGNHYGPWHDTASDAWRSARDHMTENPDHYPYL